MIQFETIEDFHAAIRNYLDKNLCITVNTESKSGDMGYGDYQNYKSHAVEVTLDGHVICNTSFDT